MQKLINKIKLIISAEAFMIKHFMKHAPLRSTLYMLLSFIRYPMPLVNTYLTKLLIDELATVFESQQTGSKIWLILAFVVGINTLVGIIMSINNTFLGEAIKANATFNLDTMIMKKVASLDMSFYEDPANRDVLSVARYSQSRISDNLVSSIWILFDLIIFATGSVVFFSINPLYSLLFLATYIPGIVISQYNKKKFDAYSVYNTPESRQKDYYYSLLTFKHTAKDLRLFNLTDYFKKIYFGFWTHLHNLRSKLFFKSTILVFVAALFTCSGTIMIIVFSVNSIILKTMTVGTLSLYLGLSITNGGKFNSVVLGITSHYLYVIPHCRNFMEFLDYKNKIEDNGTEELTDIPDIEFSNVSFRYPAGDRLVLEHLSFKIQSGKKIALIGVNGAGKTTIVNLILRFYEPTSGDILLNGISIKEYKLASLRKIFGVCFQNINSYSMTLRENVELSNLGNENAESAVADALNDAGFSDFLKWENGLGTDMTKKFNDSGRELSRGQWQKIAIARAFYRDAKFIILDEPSSALDPEAEDKIFTSFKSLCKDKGGIIISHRLSSVIMVDEIVLLENGQATEHGTHAELIEKNGAYARLYHLQADKYSSAKEGAK